MPLSPSSWWPQRDWLTTDCRGVSMKSQNRLSTRSRSSSNQLAVFVALWGLAMWHRREPAIHARYMLCTLLPLFSAPMSRLVIHFTRGIVGLIAGLGGTTLGVFEIAYSSPIYLLLIGLSVWDWRSHKRIKVFPVVLGLMFLLQVSVLTTYRTLWWRAFGEWFFGLG